MSKVNLSAPWTTFYRQVQAFFKNDAGVKVLYDEDGPEIKIYVEDPAKAAALTDLLEPTRLFGNVTLKVTVISANNPGQVPTFTSDAARFKAALAGNQAVDSIKEASWASMATPFCYVVFKKEVVQFFNDNMADLHGLQSTLYQDIANVIFEVRSGVFFCTAPTNGFGMPLGEWP